MKKNVCILFAVVFVMGLFMVTANAQAMEEETSMIQLSGLIEVGGVWQDIDYVGADPEVEDETDLCLTTVELTAEAELNKWVNVVAVLLYEDSTFDMNDGDETETTLEVDEAIVTIGNTEEYPLYVSAGKMYVPFGALLTSFPDDPLMDAPVTLVFGETLEKVLLVGVEHAGFSFSAYAFNGDVDEYGEDNNIESYGADANYSMDDESGLELLVGASYISNVADADGWEAAGEVLEDAVNEEAIALGVTIDDFGLKDYIDGFAAYLHVGFEGFFVDAEYMTALDEIDMSVNVTGGALPAGVYDLETNVEPEVWNVEVGYNWDWGKNLQIVLKYASTDEAELLGLPEDRYGICLNQDIFEDVVISLGYLQDDYDEDKDFEGRDERDLVFAQIAIEF
jgi:hypothetical protein